MNTPVSFEIAKILKNKGYDKPCNDAYNSNGMQWSNGWLEYLDDKELCQPFKKTDLKPKDVLAPTIVDVVMWLYEKHEIWIVVKRDYHNGALLGYESIIDNNDGYIDCGTFDTPTKAYEAAIEYTLNKVIK
jgi:hypothetical protein